MENKSSQKGHTKKKIFKKSPRILLMWKKVADHRMGGYNNAENVMHE